MLKDDCMPICPNHHARVRNYPKFRSPIMIGDETWVTDIVQKQSKRPHNTTRLRDCRRLGYGYFRSIDCRCAARGNDKLRINHFTFFLEATKLVKALQLIEASNRLRSYQLF